MQTIELNVAGMHCGGCEQSIARALQRLPGVRAVTASFESGRVVVDAEGPLDAAALRGAVEDAGYELVPEDGRRLPVVG